MSSKPDSPIRFTPVPVRARCDGWTPARQAAFIDLLHSSRCVIEACRGVGLSSESAYKLYRRADAEGFRRAWDAALAGPKRPRTPQEPAEAPSGNGGGGPRPDHQLPPRSSFGPAPSSPVRPVPAYAPDAFKRAVGARFEQPSTSSTSSTSTAPDRGTNGICPDRRLHQLPRRRPCG